MSKKLKFIDLFAGIGGFHLALKSLGMKCVFTSEIDEHSRKTYAANFKENYLKNSDFFNKDIWQADFKKFLTLIFCVQVFLANHSLKLATKKGLKIIKMEIYFFLLKKY